MFPNAARTSLAGTHNKTHDAGTCGPTITDGSERMPFCMFNELLLNAQKGGVGGGGGGAGDKTHFFIFRGGDTLLYFLYPTHGYTSPCVCDRVDGDSVTALSRPQHRRVIGFFF